jgi:hypothetical protein
MKNGHFWAIFLWINVIALSKLVASDAQCGNRNTEKGQAALVPEEKRIVTQNPTITPSLYPYVSNGTNSYASVDFIWWKTVIDETGYAYSGTADGYHVPPGGSVLHGTLKRPDFSFEPGVKIGLGTYFEHDGWDIYAEYTHIAGPQLETNVRASENLGVKSLVPVTTGDGEAKIISLDLARSEWKQDFNVVDLELGRNFFLSKRLALRPYIGLKTAWVHEIFQMFYVPTPNTYDPRSVSVFPPNEILAAYLRRQQHMWGLGIRGGVDTMWTLTKNWAIYGNLALSTLWSDFHIKVTDQLLEIYGGQFEPLNLYSSVQTVIPIIETGFGLAYITWFCDNGYRLQIQAGWEMQIWTDINYAQQQGSGSLSTQGLTLKTGLTF